ncbi:MAG: hypothetical protein RLZZ196_1070 [Bacteroidota bacterium]|jgi:hypothetical protein
MKLYAYGDSWTEGQGTIIDEEQKIKDRMILKDFRNKHSWPIMLANKLNCDHENNGWSGKANNLIFNEVINDLRNGKIHEGDLVVIMWSSSLRDHVHFLPKGEWISWSIKELTLLPHKFFESYKFGDDKYNGFLEDYKRFFLENMFNQNYYNIINQNYIIFLQKMLESYGVKYVFCDAFDMMVQDLRKDDDVTHLINEKNYWGFRKQTIRDYIVRVSDETAWEYPEPFDVIPSKHPNKKGYNLISEEIYNYIVKNSII